MAKETNETVPVQNAAIPSKKWQYVGPSYQNGVYMPDGMTLVRAAEIPDADIDAYVARWPQLEGQLWKKK